MGFVIAGLRQGDVRINLRGFVVRPGKLVHEVITNKNIKTNLADSKAIYEAMGRLIRAYHDSGYFHRYPHNKNWGVEFGPDNVETGSQRILAWIRAFVSLWSTKQLHDTIGLVLRDLDTTVMREEIKKGDSLRMETAYRLVDIQLIISNITPF